MLNICTDITGNKVLYEKNGLEVKKQSARHSFATNLIINSNASKSTVSSVMVNSPRVLNSRYVHPTDRAQEILVGDYQNTIFNTNKST